MKVYTLYKKQRLPISKKEAWSFLSDPKNLKTITPYYIGMKDIIDCKVPYGILGQLVQPILVKPELEEIFNYRTKKLEELFGKF